MPENPFVFGNPVRGCLFSGREDEIHEIVGRLGQMDSTSVVGNRRIGKTSLLYYLSDRSKMEKYLDSNEYRFVYFDFQGLTKITPTQFWQRILQKLSTKCENEQVSEEINEICVAKETYLFDIEDLFCNIRNKGLKIVFLFDEFEYIAGNENFDFDFFGRLRSLVTSSETEIAIVIASRQTLARISHAGALGSPFFNIFGTVFLKPFSENEARQLICKALSKDSLSFGEEEVEHLIQMTAGHPFFLQMACHYLYASYTIEGFTGDGKQTERLQNVKEKCLKQAETHFEYYWDKSSEAERIILTTTVILAHAKQFEKRFDFGNLEEYYQKAEPIISELEERTLVLPKEGQHRIFSPLFEEWIISHKIINREPPQQNYEEWLEDSRRFSNIRETYRSVKKIPNQISPKYLAMVGGWLSGNWEKILEFFTEAD